jgi:SAM-dependent methyltransferase
MRQGAVALARAVPAWPEHASVALNIGEFPSMTGLSYDEIGGTYSTTRNADPRLEAVIWGALGSAHTVINVGAGAGSYEPAHCRVTAVEPSTVMIAQRPAGTAPVVQGRAEALPFTDDSFDAAMTVLSDHHWSDRPRGLAELKRVARSRVVLLNANPAEAELFWLTCEYLPGFIQLIPARYRDREAWERELRLAFGDLALVPVPIPHDCADGFYGAFWRRPEAYLDHTVRDGISVFAQLPAEDVEVGLRALRADLVSGEWQHRHQELLGLGELHLGYYAAIADLT